MNRLTKTLAHIAAAGLLAFSSANPDRTALEQSAQELGPWAEHTINQTTHSYHDDLTYRGMSCAATYTPASNHFRWRKPLSNSRKTRALLAHEILHYSMDDDSTPGFMHSKRYSGSEPDSLRSWAEHWINAPQQLEVRQDIQQHLVEVETDSLFMLAQDVGPASAIVKHYGSQINTPEMHIAQDHLQQAKLFAPHLNTLYTIGELRNAYTMQNVHIDSALTVLREDLVGCRSVLLKVNDSRRIARCEALEEVLSITQARERTQDNLSAYLSYQEEYYYDPNEVLARMVHSIILDYHGPPTKDLYPLAEELNVLRDMKFDGASMLGPHIVEYLNSPHATTTSSTSSEYSTGVSSNSEM